MLRGVRTQQEQQRKGRAGRRSCCPLFFILRRVLGHEGTQLGYVFICLLKSTLQSVEKSAVSEDANAKRRGADARLGAVVRDFINEVFVFHGPLSGQLSIICQGQLANRLQIDQRHDYQHE